MEFKLLICGTLLLYLSVAESKRCAAELEKIHAANDDNPAPLGQYKPKCDVNGDFEVVQSHEGFNWCVDTTSGEEIKDTRKQFSKPDCKQAIEDSCKRACDYIYDPVCGSDKVKYDNRCLFEIANCTATGTLEIIQEGDCPSNAESKRCAAELERIHAANGDNPAPLGQYKPKCDVNGDFEVVQSHEGYNWCVDTTSGKEIKETRKRFAKPDCKEKIAVNTCKANGKLFQVGDHTKEVDGCNTCICFKNGQWACTKMMCIRPKCAEELKSIEASNEGKRPLVGQFKPKCDRQGNYRSVQTHEGYSWCVDAISGEEIKNTRKRFSEPMCKQTYGSHQRMASRDSTKVVGDNSQLPLILGVSIPPVVILIIITLRVFLQKRGKKMREPTVGVYAVMTS